MEVFNSRVATSPLPFADGTEDTDPIQIKKIDGLGPVVATVNTVQYGSVDGEFFNGAITGKRNIVITVGLNPNWANQSPELLRSYLYRYFMPKSKVTLRFTSTHMPQVQIDGYVETFEPNIFEKDPEYQISIICPKSEFAAVTPSSVQGTTLTLLSGSTTTINYEGTLPTGFTLTVSANATVTTSTGQFRIVNKNPGTELFIVTAATVSSTQLLEFSSVQGNKHVDTKVISSGVTTDLVSKIDPISTWPFLDIGPNIFQVLADVYGQDWTMTYTALYGGI